ncbi:MAG: twin-arginine translocation signal domain-containing protein [Acidobacteriota bacterium]
MSTYHDEQIVIKDDDEMMESHNSKRKPRLSRRKFVRHAAIGTAAAGAALALKGGTGESRHHRHGSLNYSF